MSSSRLLRRASASAVAAVVACALAGPMAAPGQAHPSRLEATTETTNPAKQYADEAVVATNRARTSRDLAKTAVSSCLRDFAVAQAIRMANASTMYNQDLAPVLRKCGLAYAAENVAWGFPNGSAVVAQGWMRSAGHRANLLNKQFTLVGVAARKDKRGDWYVSQVLGGR